MNNETETKLRYQYLFVYLPFKIVKIARNYASLNFTKPRMASSLSSCNFLPLTTIGNTIQRKVLKLNPQVKKTEVILFPASPLTLYF